MFKFGIEVLLEDKALQSELNGKRVAVLAHPASVSKNLEHTIDLLQSCKDIRISSAFGPQHGMKGDKQDNMIESEDYIDPKYEIPVFSLYGEVRKPTEKMMESFDVILIDLQEVGNRIYTYVATLAYMMDACEKYNKEVWVLDRPNPIGRPVEGLTLDMKFETFVGSMPIPMRHGLTMGELANWYKAYKNYTHSLKVVTMDNYDPNKEGEWGWPKGLSWINPSPNLPRLSGCQMYAGTVLLEGTWLSEGRGTTIPLEVVGAPDIDSEKIVQHMKDRGPKEWLHGCLLRPCYFEPTFQKHVGKLCAGFQIHVDHTSYDHENFKSFRLVSLFLKSLKQLYPKYHLWREPPYEYEETLMPFDMLSGSSILREWVDNKTSSYEGLETQLQKDEQSWLREREKFLIY